MNILLWTLQILIALHTAVGAIWKFSNSSEQTMPSFAVIPQGVWLAMSVVELLCALALVLPLLNKSLAFLVPVAAGLLVAEMLLFCGLQLYFAEGQYSPLVYWLIVAALCSFVAYGRMVLEPLSQTAAA
ncbi:hypothetical protein [Bowmanella dokdonensis]|uniref:DoxX family protein n=1 Tax=Bowmanella dokdonensis TaxID=751969 RepID=A0A939DJQ9_9ALTE|nr:hypothetical protein [Bowmanella dokdonensis]MBN7823912.1 hypothetical protein [Bowmanella dokdonensis]